MVFGLKMGLTQKNHPKWHFPPWLFGQRQFFSLNNFFRAWPEHGESKEVTPFFVMSNNAKREASRATSYFHTISDNLYIKFDNDDKKGNLVDDKVDDKAKNQLRNDFRRRLTVQKSNKARSKCRRCPLNVRTFREECLSCSKSNQMETVSFD